MNKRKISSILNLVLTLSMVLAMVSPALAAPAAQTKEPPPPPSVMGTKDGQAVPAEPADPPEPPKPPTKELERGVLTTEEALLKIHPDLRDLAQNPQMTLPEDIGPTAGAQEAIMIQVMASEGIDLSAYFVDGKVYARPAMSIGVKTNQAYIGFVNPSSLIKIASLYVVDAIIPMVMEQNAAPDAYPADDPVELPERGPEEWAALQANANKLREGVLPWDQAKAFGDGREGYTPKDWFEASPDGPHKAQSAWYRGYTGEGVSVAVLDDGIDPAHPDLMGTQKIYSSPAAPQYDGWPMVFSPFSQLLYFQDEFFGTSYIADGYYSSHFVDTSYTPDLTPCDVGVSCFDYTPLIDVGVPGFPHTYIIDNAMTQSGVVHVGTHPDMDLRDFVWGEKPAVLVADPNVAGVYDTVYVDLDDDYDFRDEKPLTRANPADPSTYNDMIAYRDFNNDGLADISGGMVYFIGDGENVVPASDYMWGAACPGFMCPGNGDLVAFSGSTFDRSYSHGTQCASNVVGQGVADGMLPEFRDLPGDGFPDGAVFGMAPNAEMVNISDIYYNFDGSKVDAYFFAAVGYDGIPSVDPSDTDPIQITSNSYGSSSTDNDGWEYDGQLVSQIQRWYAPSLQFLFSTGNGAPAYGTVAPPSAGTAIAVGASTQFGSTGWDSITDTHQIMNNDVTPFSNRGPGARGTQGTDVVAGGAFAAGAEELNYYSTSTWGAPDGNLSWVSWGGTSRSAPVAMGVLALIYDAYYQANGDWPSHEEAKALLMASATDLNYDVFTQGGGSVNADRGTAVAGGEYGLYAMPATWQPGDYRGEDFPGFAHLVYPGDTWNQTITVENPGIEPITATVSDVELLLIDTVEFDFTVTAAQVADEEDNFYKAFNYFIPITATAGMDASWYNIDVPPDADLMIVRQMFPFDQFDYDGDYSWDNRFYLMVYNWQDVDADGIVWDDKDANGVVDFVNDTEITLIDYGSELLWDDPVTELDRWEYGRFSYHRPYGNRNEMWVHDPLDRMLDGLFIGLRHHPGSTYTGDTTLSYRIEFYSEQDVDWLSTDVTSIAVPAGGSATFTTTANVPADIPTGIYQAAIEVYDSGWVTFTGGMTVTYDESTTVIPVAMSVAEDFSESMTLGGSDSYAYDADRPYNNAAVRGLFDWGWRAESGDWRFFFTDLQNTCTITDTQETPVALWEEGFEGSWLPAGWMSYMLGDAFDPGFLQTSARAHTGTYSAFHNDDNLTTSAESWLVSPQFTVPISATFSFWEDNASTSSYYEYHGVWISTGSCDPVDAAFVELAEYSEDLTDWIERTVDMGDYAGQDVCMAFRYQGDWEDDWYLDDVAISGVELGEVCLEYPYDGTEKLIVVDQWDDVAPHTDIDTLVFGPTFSEFSYDEPDYYGPYTLDTIASSPNMNIGAGVWLFDTSSGGNEDWISAPLYGEGEDWGGLHEIVQHNVLFQGDKFDVVFTKTLGTLWEDIHSFSIDTYVDAGLVGTVNIVSGLDLNGLVTDSVLFEIDHQSWDDEPVDFVSSNTIEWMETFVITDAIDMEMWTSSADISDIDLYLFYFDGAGWVQMGASTTGTADENIYLTAPADGTWMVGINNWSGPAGHFDLDLVVRSEIGELIVTGATNDPIAAGTPISLTISYDYPMTPGNCYEGLVWAGPPEATYLKEIPVNICRLPESAMVIKTADREIVYPGMEYEYTVDLYNLSDEGALFTFFDAIPGDTEFVTITGITGDCLDYCIGDGLLSESFESSWLPTGWAEYQLGDAVDGWEQTTTGDYITLDPHSGSYMAWHNDENVTTGGDSWLVSPQINVPADAGLSFWQAVGWNASYDYHGVLVTTDADPDPATATYTEVWSGNGTASWTEQFVDLSAYAGQDIYIAFNYKGDYATEWYIDDVSSVVCKDVYDSVSNALSFTTTLPLSPFDLPRDEGFEGGLMPPASWEVDNIVGPGWEITNDADWVNSGSFAGLANYDGNEDIWLYSPWLQVDAADPELSFWAYSATDHPLGIVDGHNVQVHVIGDGFDDIIWDMQADEYWLDFAYREVVLDLSAYAGQEVRVAWNYVEWTWTMYKAVFALDDVYLPGSPMPEAACSFDVTVRVDDTATPGTIIPNIASLMATHFLPQETQEEEFVSSDVDVLIDPLVDYPFITKTVDRDLIFPDDILVYTIVIDNYLNPDVAGPTVFFLQDILPENVEFVSITGALYDAVLKRIWFEGVVDDIHIITLTVRVDGDAQDGDLVINTATLESDLFEGVVLDSTAETTVRDTDFTTSYKVATANVLPGEAISYEVHVINTGAQLAENVTMTDPIPANTTLVSYDPGVGSQLLEYNPTLNQLEWTGNIPPGDEWVFYYTVMPDADLAAGTIIENVATIAWDGNEIQVTAQTEAFHYQVYLPVILK